MAYTAKTAQNLREETGSLLSKIASELSLIDAQIDTIDALADGKVLIGNGSDVATEVTLSGDVTTSNAGVTAIGEDKVANSMLENITRGSVKVGGASDAPTDLVAKTSGQILVGDGTDIASVAMSGDLDISANGTITIGSDKVASSMAEPTFIKVVSGALAADVSGNFAFAWQNPEDAKVLVHRVIVDITTAGGEVGAKLDAGVAPNATTAANDIFDDIDANATAVSDHLLESGAGLGGVHKVDENAGTNDYITGAILVKDASSLAGYYYIMYTEVAG